MNEILVTVGGIVLIALIVWWFWFPAIKRRRVENDK